MNRVLFLICLVFVLGISACDDSENSVAKGSLEIVFKGKYNGAPLVLGQTYTYLDGARLLLTRSDFFMTQIKLKKGIEKYLLRDIEYIALLDHHTTVDRANAGFVVQKFEGITVGSYDGLDFGLGLTKAQNATKPKDYAAPHPLSEGSRYWAGWNSYVFSKTEGVYEKNGEQINFTYHSGFDSALRQIDMTHQIEIKENETTRLIIDLEHQLLFGTIAEPLDIKANPQIHNTSRVMDLFMDRFKTAFFIE